MLCEIEIVLNNFPLCFIDDNGMVDVLMANCWLYRRTLSLEIIAIYGETSNWYARIFIECYLLILLDIYLLNI